MSHSKNLPPNKFRRYGFEWDKKLHNDLFVELFAFRAAGKEAVEGGFLRKQDHFWNCCDLMWNNNPLAPTKVFKTPWSERMARGMCENKYCCLAGSSSSGKSHILAAYGLVSYMSAPMQTKVIITSTTMTAARDRVWKSITQLWLSSFPGKMVQSKCLIRGYDEHRKLSETTGLKILAPSGSASDEIDSAFIGIKATNILVLLDELTDIPMGVLNSCLNNLSDGAEGDNFELKAASNPNLYTDPFGTLCKPVGGWNSVTEHDMEWETSRGICMRFDSEQSPNLEAGEILYPWLPKRENIEKAKEEFGERSRLFFRFHKAFWFPDAADETVYSEGELIKAKADRPIREDEFGGVNPQEVYAAGGDPSYTQGGDRFPVIIGRVVQIDGKSVLEVMDTELIKDDVDATEGSRSYYSVSEMEKICVKRSIDPENFGFDMTGAGIPFRDIVVSQWSSLPLGVNFGGFASKLQISPVDLRLANDVYANRVTELWVRAKGLLREGRIRGMSSEMVAEICERRWAENSGKGRKLKIESKVDMKKRGLRSPDIADSFFVLLEVVIRRGLMGEMEEIELDKRAAPQWENSMELFDIQGASDLDLTYD